MSSQLKNIRRRLYDAINVLAAVDVLQKSKSWLTLANSQLCESLSTGTCTQKNNEVVQLLEETTNRIKQKRKRI